MIAGWQWDETLFAGAAPHYLRGRLPYAPGFAETISGAVEGHDRLLDVGCGPGNVTVALAPYFAEVVGLDPDPGMLAEAQRHEVPHARWVRGRAEDLPAGLGEFSVVVFASSFHWTDRERVAATVREMLAPGGALVHLADRKQPVVAGPPYPQIGELVRRYLGPVRRAGQGVLAAGVTPDGEDRIIEAAGFVDMRRYVVAGGQTVERDEDDLVAWTFSMSHSAPHLFGDRVGEFEADLRALLRAAGGRFTERLPDSEIRIWRRP